LSASVSDSPGLLGRRAWKEVYLLVSPALGFPSPRPASAAVSSVSTGRGPRAPVSVFSDASSHLHGPVYLRSFPRLGRRGRCDRRPTCFRSLNHLLVLNGSISFVVSGQAFNRTGIRNDYGTSNARYSSSRGLVGIRQFPPPPKVTAPAVPTRPRAHDVRAFTHTTLATNPPHRAPSMAAHIAHTSGVSLAAATNKGLVSGIALNRLEHGNCRCSTAAGLVLCRAFRVEHLVCVLRQDQRNNGVAAPGQRHSVFRYSGWPAAQAELCEARVIGLGFGLRWVS